MTRPVLFTGDIFRLQQRGGITRYFSELIPRLERPATIVAGVHQSRSVRSGSLAGAPALYVRGFRLSPRPRAAVNRWIDARRLGRAKNEILHATYYRDPASLPLQAPVVVTVYDMAHERFPSLFRRAWWRSEDPARWKAALCGRADRILCISESTRRDLRELLGVAEAKTRVIHLGTTDWRGISARPVEGIDPPFFLWVGERHTYKNFDRTLRAWAESRAAASSSLLCVGGPELTRNERETIRSLGVSGRVRRQSLEDASLRWAYEHAAGLLYTSLCEGFGLPLVEAMSLNCPIVAARVSSIPEVAGEVPIYIDPEDPESIRSGIERCLEAGRGLAEERGSRARAALFSWDRCAAAHEAVYEELD